MASKRPYGWLADQYDKLFERSRFPLVVAREHVLGRILPRIESACDLACGTGTTALALARGGLRVIAVDACPAMCRVAREKFRRAGLPVRVLCADMRAFRLPEPVDLITCEGDALNHVPRKADLDSVAKAVARALRPDGYFFFDVNNSAGFERYWSETVWLEQPGLAAVMRNSHDSAHDCAWSEIDLFIREGAVWRRRHERIDEVCWCADEIRGALRDAGFNRMRAWDATPFFEGNLLLRPGCRTVYLARKAAA